MGNPPDRSPVDAHPWYRYFWPWFLIGLLACSMAGSISLLVIAMQNPDPLVSDDWYQEGKGINRQLERDRVAVAMGLSAELFVDDLTGDVLVVLEGAEAAKVQSIELKLEHPTRAESDQVLVLRWVDHLQRYQGQLDHALRGRWYMTLSSMSEGAVDRRGNSWRLKQSMIAPPVGPIRFDPAR
jgi:hypothetical protein